MMVTNIGFSATQAKVSSARTQVSNEQPAVVPADVVESGAKHGIGTKIGLGALGGLALIGGMGCFSAPPAQAETVIYQCQADPYQYQDEALLGHMSTLYASPATGYNPAAGIYDADGGYFSQANEMSRLDGHQALKQLSCGHPVRLYSPQTGWLKFGNLNSLHRYVGTYGQPWDHPGVYLGNTSGYGTPWYDAQYNQYNDYNSYRNQFYYGVQAPIWDYVAPPTYTPPSSWNQAPPDGNWNQAPNGTWNQNQAPADPGSSNWNQAPSGGSWNQAPPASNGGGSWNQAPPASNGGGGSWNQAPPASNGGGGSWNQAPPASKGGGSNWNQAPPASGGGSWNQAPPASSGGGSWNQAPAASGSQAPANW
ncbi:MAG TPA: hypothetical protein VGO93_18530 [Candidatus Xenobia bacterium]|jgi:hypothetical protein